MLKIIEGTHNKTVRKNENKTCNGANKVEGLFFYFYNNCNNLGPTWLGNIYYHKSLICLTPCG